MRKLLRKLLIWLGVSQPLVEDVDYRIRVLKGLGYGLVGSQQLVIFHHLLDGFTVTDNSPQVGYIAWSNLHIVYKGIDYTITDGNTNLKFAWWDYSVSTTTLQCQDTLPDTTDDDLIIFLNKNGIHATVPTTTCIDGSLIITESILAGALSANCVTSEKIYAGAVIAEKIATDAVVASKIYAGAITTDKLDAAAITTAKIADLAVTNAKINDLSADKITAGTITATLSFSGQTMKMVSGAAYTYLWQSSNDFYIRNYNGNIELQPATNCATKFLVGNLMPDQDNTLKCGLSTAAWSEVHCYLLVDHTPILTGEGINTIKNIKTEANGKIIPSSLPGHIYVPREGTEGTDGVNLGNLVGLTLDAIKELDQRIKVLEK